MLAIPILGKEHVASIEIDKEDEYTGYESFYFTEDEMADFYSSSDQYGEKLKINQYVNIYNKETQERVDTLCWTEEGFRQLKYKNFTSKELGDIKPFKGDIY